MTWYQSRDDDYVSPIVRGMRRDTRKPDQKARDRILDDDEIRGVWNAATEFGGAFGDIVKLCLLTAQRRNKIAAMQWRDVDLEKGVWTIQREDGEKGTPSALQLPQMATDILTKRPRVNSSPYVFASTAKGQVTRNKYGHLKLNWLCFNSWSEGKRELDNLLPPMKHWTIHDLRRTARSLMARIGVQTEIAERVLGHKQQGIIGVYDRHKYEDEMGKALRLLAAKIDDIRNARERVVPLHGATA